MPRRRRELARLTTDTEPKARHAPTFRMKAFRIVSAFAAEGFAALAWLHLGIARQMDLERYDRASDAIGTNRLLAIVTNMLSSRCNLLSSCRRPPASQHRVVVVASSSLKAAPLQPLNQQGELQLYKLADLAGVYAIYDKGETLQYIGLSRKAGWGSRRRGRPTSNESEADPSFPCRSMPAWLLTCKSCPT